MKQLIQILSFLFITNVFYAQKQVNPVLKELNEIILNTKLYGGFYNGMTREVATNEYETNKYSKYYRHNKLCNFKKHLTIYTFCIYF